MNETQRTMRPRLNGISISIQYPNGYSVSVVCHEGSYGGSKGLFELAVLHDDEFIEMDFMGGNNVAGWLDFGEVSKILQQISELPEAK